MLNEYMKLIDFDPEQTDHKNFLKPKRKEPSLAQSKSEKSDDEQSQDGFSALENDQRIDSTPRSNNDSKKTHSNHERNKMSKLIKNLLDKPYTWKRLPQFLFFDVQLSGHNCIS